MVLWSSGNSGRDRILSSKRMLLSGSLLLLGLFYYVALPDPQAGSLDGRTAFQAESAFRKNKKGSALADDSKIMILSPVREDRPVKTFPWLNSFVERVKLKKRLPVTDYLRGEQEMSVEVMEDDEGNGIDVTSEAAAVEDITTTSMNGDWSDEKEAESIQEEDDEQGSEKEDGADQELLEQLEEAEAISELEAEEVLEDAIGEPREEHDEEILDETEDEIMNRLEEGEEEILDRIEEAEEASDEVLTDEMVRMIEDEVVAEEEASLDEDIHQYVETFFHGDEDSKDEEEEGYEDEEEEVAAEIESEVAAEAEVEPEYKEKDLLGQAGSGETMVDEE
ncbi:hypothetical protein BGZ47_007502 [Haplosporangium gracile]|nr:hypothetical protein BGZ47_007502 [Haplosporangium gracile]